MAEWTTLSSDVAFENSYMRIYSDQAINHLGKEVNYSYVESTDNSAYIVPASDDGHIYLIRQYRYPLKQSYWEIPAGRIPHNENLTEGAKRELVEETGLAAQKITTLGVLLSTPGITNFKSTVFVAEGLTQTGGPLDEIDGILEAKPFTVPEIKKMIGSGEVQCSVSIAALYMAIDHLKEMKRWQ
jgi:8-oxo-dGTP pyrophosphatase MutT (NUDIX family)